MRSERSGEPLQNHHPLLGRPIQSGEGAYAWQTELDPGSLPFLHDHRLAGIAVLPGAVFVEMALAAATAVLGAPPPVITEVTFRHVLPLAAGAPLTIVAVLSPRQPGGLDFRVHGQAPAPGKPLPEPYVSLWIPAETVPPPSPGPEESNPALVRGRCPEELPGDALYARLAQGGNEYGPALRAVERVWRGPGETLGALRLPDQAGPFHVPPVLLDALFQVVAAAAPGEGGLFLLAGLETLRICGPPQGCTWAHARLRAPHEEDGGPPTGDARLLDDAGRTTVEATGVRFKRLPRRPQSGEDKPALRIAVTATFTAQPLEDALRFWMKELARPARVLFAPYGQVFEQLLNPASLLRGNPSGWNIVLLSLADWMRDDGPPAAFDAQTRERLLAKHPRIRLPNQLEIAHLNRYETEYLYREIFTERAYLKQHLTLREGACVVDVGANIGLFTLFVSRACRASRVFAFEPAPPLFDVLRVNAALYAPQAKVFNCGLSDRDGEAPFTFYPKASVFSGFRAAPAEDRAALQAVVRNLLAEHSTAEKSDQAARADELIADRFESETFTGRLRTLAGVVREEGIERIDLLKVDAEKSELEILRGVGAAWDMIHQVVVEAHTPGAVLVGPITLLLEAQGFAVAVEESPALRGSGLYTIYGTRRADPVRDAPTVSQAGAVGGALERKLQAFTGALRAATEASQIPHLVCVCPAPPAAVADPGRRGLFERLEQRLASAFAGDDLVDVVRPAELLELYPVAAYEDIQADQEAHIPYTPALFAALGSVIARRYHARQRDPYKVIVLDADQTLWRGICGEDGPLGVTIAPCFRDLQEFMVKQHDAGMLLCLCSKNNPEDVRAVFGQHPEMPLRPDHFVATRINWRPKSENLRALADELRLGLESFIFLDNNAAECAEVRARCPQVLTIRLPDEESTIPHVLRHVWAFDRVHLTAEDRQRARLYREGQGRQAVRQQSGTVRSFLESLELQVRIADAVPAQFARVAQLTQRTNQFNCTTIRRTEAEVAHLLGAGEAEGLVVQVRDRFGDHGLVGAVLFRVAAPALVADTLLLSCRVLGLGVEYRILARLGELAAARGLEQVQVPFAPSGRNQPAADFLRGVSRRTQAPPPRASPDRTERLLFSFPVASLLDLRYDPDADGPGCPAPATEATIPEAASDWTPSLGSGPRLLERIAEELRDVQQILDAIRSRTHRPRAAGASAFVPAHTDVEQTLRDIWQDVLGIKQVGIHDNFFDLGGTSLDAVQVVAELKRRLGCDVPTVTFFEKTTINSLAGMLQAGEAEGDWSRQAAAGRRRGEERRLKNRSRRRRS